MNVSEMIMRARARDTVRNTLLRVYFSSDRCSSSATSGARELNPRLMRYKTPRDTEYKITSALGNFVLSVCCACEFFFLAAGIQTDCAVPREKKTNSLFCLHLSMREGTTICATN